MTSFPRHQSISIAAPITGWVWSLGETPDPVFANGMMGDGVAIDPMVGEVRAPFDGEVVVVNPSCHAVILRHTSGLEVLVHVGIDTVALAGEGFELLVQVGQAVGSGELLLRFDLDKVACTVPSLVSPVVVVTGEAFEITEHTAGRHVATGDLLMTVRPRHSAAEMTPTTALVHVAEAKVHISLLHGVHARPAAALARILRRHGAAGRVQHGDRVADLLSLVSVMAMGLKASDQVVVQVHGDHANDALAEIVALLEGAYAEVESLAPVSTSASVISRITTGEVRGVCGAPGMAVGPAFRFAMAPLHIAETASDPVAEAERLELALASAIMAIGMSPATGALRDVLDAHAGLLEDVALRQAALEEIGRGTSAAAAWRVAVEVFIEVFESSGDPRLTERVSDLRDVELQVLHRLLGNMALQPVSAPLGSILLADDLTPSQLSTFADGALAGVCLAKGGATSHVAVIAAAMGLPMLTAAGPQAMTAVDGQILVLDADGGVLLINPDPAQVGQARRVMEAIQAQAKQDRRLATSPATTRDGVRIEIFANLGTAGDAGPAVANGAEGCGLLRTEFLFMDRSTPPSEDEQSAEYQQVLDGLQGRPLVIRTLDAGGDKPVSFLPAWHEPNPALGMRGVRTSLAVPDLLRAQLRAIVRLVPSSNVSIMVPMVTGIGELEQVRRILWEEMADLGVAGPISLGVMIETPSSVLMAAQLARSADFFSIGTNDLAQYVLAMDRTSEWLAGAADALHPAVLKAMAMTVDGAASANCPVSVCGGLASDPLAVPLLLGLGVRRLSCTPAMIAPVKAQIRRLDLAACQSLAAAAQGLSDAVEVRALVRRTLSDLEA